MTQIPKAAKVRFLDTLARTGNLAVAYDVSGVSHHRLNVLRKDDAEFAELWDRAIEAGIDTLESEAIHRALEGIEEVVYYHGEQIGTVRRYSDGLLIFLLKALRPEKYGDNPKVKEDESVTELLREIDERGRETDPRHTAAPNRKDNGDT